jgi:hypothetical protein
MSLSKDGLDPRDPSTVPAQRVSRQLTAGKSDAEIKKAFHGYTPGATALRDRRPMVFPGQPLALALRLTRLKAVLPPSLPGTPHWSAGGEPPAPVAPPTMARRAHLIQRCSHPWGRRGHCFSGRPARPGCHLHLSRPLHRPPPRPIPAAGGYGPALRLHWAQLPGPPPLLADNQDMATAGASWLSLAGPAPVA